MNIKEIKNYWDHARSLFLDNEDTYLGCTFDECLTPEEGWDGVIAFITNIGFTLSRLWNVKRELEDVLAWLRKHKEEL